MKKIYIYIALILIVLGTLYYYFDMSGIIGGLFGVGAVAGKAFKSKQNELQAIETAIDHQVAEIEKEKKKLETDGVEDKTSKEEADYWKNQ